jgi:hypothetical protein
VGVDDFSDDERDFGEEQGGSEGMQEQGGSEGMEGMQEDDERMGERMGEGGGEGDMGDQSQGSMDDFGGQGGEDDQSDEYDR